MDGWYIVIYCIDAVVIACSIAILIVITQHFIRSRREFKKWQEKEKARQATRLVTIDGPSPGGSFALYSGAHGHIDALAPGQQAIVNLETGEVEYKFPKDTNAAMEPNFSLDELETAQEYINSGGKLH